METEAYILMKVQGVEIDEEERGFGAIDRTGVPTSEQVDSSVWRIPQHLLYHHLRVSAVKAALVVA